MALSLLLAGLRKGRGAVITAWHGAGNLRGQERVPWHALVPHWCGPTVPRFEKHTARARRSWRKLHIGLDDDTGQIIAAELTQTLADLVHLNTVRES